MNIVTLLATAAVALSAALAVGVAIYARRSVARWAFAVGMAALAADCFCSILAVRAGLAEPAELVRWQKWSIIFLSLMPGTWLLFSLTYARGNAGSFARQWWLGLVIAFFVPPLLVAVFPRQLFGTLDLTRAGDDWLLHLGWSGTVLYLCVVLTAVLVTMNLERTFRASAGTRRWRIKFMLLGTAVLFVVRLYSSSQVLLFTGITPAGVIINACGLLVGGFVVLRSIFRTGNFDLDVYPSQSVLHGSVTALLAGTYLLIIGAFATIVKHFGGEAAFALKTFLILLSLVLLAILLQSDRVHLYLGRFISRHFQRPLHDYRTLWRQFTEGTASRVEQADLCRSLVKLSADTFQALSVSIWLADEKSESLVLAASTSLPGAGTTDDRSYRTEAKEVLDHFRRHPEVVDIDAAQGNWATKLRQWHPTEFRTGGNRVCIPLIGRREVLGLMTLGDRVSGTLFAQQDFDILKCIGDHAAASLLNVQLSQRLLQSRELEAFQTMAAFFVHDLKNAASTLNLMLQNLPVHFDDPAFRQDALRGIGKTASHINHLVSRLGQLRHDLKLQVAPANLNAMVEQALAAMGRGGESVFVKTLVSLPEVSVDREQIHKVVTNLLLNAAEATPGKNPVRISTEHDGEWVVLTVADEGCGMTSEFIRTSLFRPFQTTKKSGLGIGMFQSKMIVEAHHGRIAVASEPGKGTTFRVFLPVSKSAG